MRNADTGAQNVLMTFVRPDLHKRKFNAGLHKCKHNDGRHSAKNFILESLCPKSGTLLGAYEECRSNDAHLVTWCFIRKTGLVLDIGCTPDPQLKSMTPKWDMEHQLLSLCWTRGTSFGLIIGTPVRLCSPTSSKTRPMPAVQCERTGKAS